MCCAFWPNLPPPQILLSSFLRKQVENTLNGVIFLFYVLNGQNRDMA